MGQKEKAKRKMLPPCVALVCVYGLGRHALTYRQSYRQQRTTGIICSEKQDDGRTVELEEILMTKYLKRKVVGHTLMDLTHTENK